MVLLDQTDLYSNFVLLLFTYNIPQTCNESFCVSLLSSQQGFLGKFLIFVGVNFILSTTKSMLHTLTILSQVIVFGYATYPAFLKQCM